MDLVLAQLLICRVACRQVTSLLCASLFPIYKMGIMIPTFVKHFECEMKRVLCQRTHWLKEVTFISLCGEQLS